MALVDIDLEEFDLDDLIKEVKMRVISNKKFVGYEIVQLKELAREINAKISLQVDIEVPNLKDHFKNQYLIELREKYSEEQLREMVEVYNEKTR